DKPIRALFVDSKAKMSSSKAKKSRTLGGGSPPPPPLSPAPSVMLSSPSRDDLTGSSHVAREELAKMKEEWDETDIESDVLPEDIEAEEEEILSENIVAPQYVSPKAFKDEFTAKSFIGSEELLDEGIIEIPEEKPALHSRDLSIYLPKNMCLDEVFRLRITLSKSDEFSKHVSIKQLELSKKEAEYFSLTAKKLGKDILEATTRIEGLEQGNLTVRPLSTSNVVTIAPLQRTIYFDPEEEELVVEFYLAPKRWIPDPISILRVEFEQNYKIIRTIDLPMKIYKRQFEALFGFNLSKWHKYALLIYGILSTLIGLYSTLAEYIDILPTFGQLFS
ncbi:MAG: hypothetical protein KGD64_14925, partial [Candidatus Heimdallarchaeota archaeon]|nr:hypothetical protein [Candidatus Heimdallarchaeota archaeon]